MKKTKHSLKESLVLELKNLYCCEKKLCQGMNKLSKETDNNNLLRILSRYRESTVNKRLKMHRIFPLLQDEPSVCHMSVIDDVIHETYDRLQFTEATVFRDLLLHTCLQRINTYKTDAYRKALRFSKKLGLEIAAEQLTIIISWELKIKRKLEEIAQNELHTAGVLESAYVNLCLAHIIL